MKQTDLKTKIAQIQEEISELIRVKIDLENQLYKIQAKEIIKSNVLSCIAWSYSHDTQLFSHNGWDDLTKEQKRLLNPNQLSKYSVQLDDYISVGFDLDDGDIWLSADSSDYLREFIAFFSLKVSFESLTKHAQRLTNELENIQFTLNKFGV